MIKYSALAISQCFIYLLFIYFCISGFSLSFDTGKSEGASAIGVIGGADGPTAIFVASSFSWSSSALFQALLIGIVSFTLNLSVSIKSSRRKYKLLLIVSVFLFIFYEIIIFSTTTFGVALTIFTLMLFISGYLISDKINNANKSTN